MPPRYRSPYLCELRPAAIPSLRGVPLLGYSKFDLRGERRVGPAVASVCVGQTSDLVSVCGVSYSCHQWGRMAEEPPFVLSTCKYPDRTGWAGLGHVPVRERHGGWSPRRHQVPLKVSGDKRVIWEFMPSQAVKV